jgi:D-xylulose reductase
MAFAATPPYDGTLARFYRLPEDFCYELPEHVPLEQGALMEPAAVAVHVCRAVDIRPGKSVVVFGAGPVGLLCCAVAKALGADKIVSVDINEERVKLAQEYVASHAFRPDGAEKAEDGAKRMLKECDLGLGADAVVDATGAATCIQMGIHVLRAGGIYCQAGMVSNPHHCHKNALTDLLQGNPEVNFPITAMCIKELTVKGSFRYGPGDYEMAVELLSTGKIKVERLISRKVGFREAEDAFKDTKTGRGIKILIEGPST